MRRGCGDWMRCCLALCRHRSLHLRVRGIRDNHFRPCLPWTAAMRAGGTLQLQVFACCPGVLTSKVELELHMSLESRRKKGMGCQRLTIFRYRASRWRSPDPFSCLPSCLSLPESHALSLSAPTQVSKPLNAQKERGSIAPRLQDHHEGARCVRHTLDPPTPPLLAVLAALRVY